MQSGKIDVKEFQAAHVRGQLGVDTEQMRKAFDAIDTDGDGVLDEKEMEQIRTSLRRFCVKK